MRQVELIYGNCLKKMSDIPDKSIDMILADPPYGITEHKWDIIIPIEPMWKQLKRIIKKNSAIVLFGSQPFTSTLVMSNIKMFKYEWIWDKEIGTGFQIAKYRPMQRHENIMTFCKGTPNYYPIKTKRSKPISGYATNPRYLLKTGRVYTDKHPTSILLYKKIKVGFHPSQKPIALMKYLIQTYTKEEETVLDFAMGSGTTGVACKNLNRKFIGIEMKRKIFIGAKQRIGKAGIERTTTSCKNADQFFGRFLNERKIKRREK